MLLRNIIGVIIASFIGLLLLPEDSFSQPWSGFSVSWTSGNYDSSGEFTQQSTFFGYKTNLETIDTATYSTLGDGTGFQIGYQHAPVPHYSIYYFLDELSGKPSSLALESYDRKESNFQDLGYTQKGSGLETRLWMEALYIGLGIVYIEEIYEIKNINENIITSTSIKTEPKSGLIYSVGTEIPKLGLTLRLSERSTSKLISEDRQVNKLSSLRFNIGYRWGRR